MLRKFIIAVVLVFKGFNSTSQHPFKHWTDAMETRYSATDPSVDYTLTIDETDFSFFSVEMIIRNIPDTFRVAMVTHPEYDDRYWRYVENISVKAKNGDGKVVREDSAVWRIVTNGREAVVSYRIHLPVVNGIRSAWK